MTEPTANAALDELVARVVDEYEDRLARGESPAPEEYAARHPEAADEIRGVLGIFRLGADHLPARPPGPPDALGDFRIVRELGRGGMGVVYEAEQLSLRRRVALKVLPFAATMDPRQLARFRNETYAAASLQHGNIVPVYFVGCDRGIHYYAMQFIDGRPLSAVLHEQRQGREAKVAPTAAAEPWEAATVPRRSGKGAPAAPQADTAPVGGLTTERGARGAAYFRAVARLGEQAALALQHAHDMGVLHRDVKPGNLLLDARGNVWVTDFGLARVQSEASLTMTGDLVGTLRYMSPEQALARRVVIDQRTDVYSLGTTLYELLTLRPVFEGKDRQELLRQIAFEEPPAPRQVNSAVPAELETVVLKALEKAPQDRYATAQEMADDLRRYLEDRPVRARRPSLGQRLMKVVRRHRAVAVTAAAGLVVALAVLAGSVGWAAGERRARQEEAQRVTEKVVEEALKEAAGWLRKDRPYEALSAALRAEAAVRQVGGYPGVQPQVDEMLWDVRLLLRLEQARLEAAAVRDGYFDSGAADSAYEQAFREFGLDVLAMDVEEAARRVSDRPIRAELTAFLEDWALRRKGPSSKRLLEVVRRLDPDERRHRLRSAMASRNIKELARVIREEGPEDAPASLLLRMDFRGLESPLAEPERRRVVERLRQVQRARPDDFWANHALAAALRTLRPRPLEEEAGYFRVAVALRPRSPGAHLNLGSSLLDSGKADEAIASYREAIRLRPDYAEAQGGLGRALRGKGQLDQAIACHKEAIRLKPGDYRHHVDLGNALYDKGKADEATACYREAIRLKPDLAVAHFNLGGALRHQGKVDEAAACYREALRLKPDYAEAHKGLGDELGAKGRADEAVACYREAIRLKPDFAEAHGNLGLELGEKGKVDEAVTYFREALRLKPDFAEARYNLGRALRTQGKVDEAAACYREAIRLKPDYAEAHCNLGLILREQGRFESALEGCRLGHDLGSRRPNWPYPSAEWVKAVEILVGLDRKLPAVLRGEERPADAAEAVGLAELCLLYPNRRNPAASARLYAAALDADPKLAQRLGGHRYNAACAAALAGCGQGEGAAGLGPVDRLRWRRQALTWLDADLRALRRLFTKEPVRARQAVAKTTRQWLADPDFAGVRGPEALARLPEEERAAWRRLWRDADELRGQAESPKLQPTATGTR